MNDSFAVFILTHGRPKNVQTYRMIRNEGYSGLIYIIVDNEDKAVHEYKTLYGAQVIVFDKAAIAQTFDEGDNFNDRRAVIYARNASFQIARDLGLDYFLQLDDDYSEICYEFAPDLTYRRRQVHNLDELFAVILEFYKAIPAVTIAMGQKGELIGGQYSNTIEKLWLKRKAMNSFFCSTARPFTFVGRINEDVNTYVSQGNRGDLFFTFYNAIINQLETQQASGGMTELYLDSGTYIKSFYTVMYAPSCVRISEVGTRHRRLHHRINWERAVPRILGEQYRKPSNKNPADEAGL